MGLSKKKSDNLYLYRLQRRRSINFKNNYKIKGFSTFFVPLYKKLLSSLLIGGLKQKMRVRVLEMFFKMKKLFLGKVSNNNVNYILKSRRVYRKFGRVIFIGKFYKEIIKKNKKVSKVFSGYNSFFSTILKIFWVYQRIGVARTRQINKRFSRLLTGLVMKRHRYSFLFKSLVYDYKSLKYKKGVDFDTIFWNFVEGFFFTNKASHFFKKYRTNKIAAKRNFPRWSLDLAIKQRYRQRKKFFWGVWNEDKQKKDYIKLSRFNLYKDWLVLKRKNWFINEVLSNYNKFLGITNYRNIKKFYDLSILSSLQVSFKKERFIKDYKRFLNFSFFFYEVPYENLTIRFFLLKMYFSYFYNLFLKNYKNFFIVNRDSFIRNLFYFFFKLFNKILLLNKFFLYKLQHGK